jgi:hypothetical protein
LGSYYTFACPAASFEAEIIVPAGGGPVTLASLMAAPSGTGEVLSVFGRTGAVAAKSGDYKASEVTGALEATQAKHVATSGTAKEIIESLTAAGIMAAS